MTASKYASQQPAFRSPYEPSLKFNDARNSQYLVIFRAMNQLAG